MSPSILQEGQASSATGEDSLRQYLQEIRSYPQLTAEQERALAMRCAQGDEEAGHGHGS